MTTMQEASERVPVKHLWELSAVQLAVKIASGEVTAGDAVEAHVARIEAVNPGLNAVVVKRYEAARAEAREADQRRAAGGRLGPLHGVPITIKECLDLEGTPSTFGLPSRSSINATNDDRYVARMRQAGAIVLGKTNVAQLLGFVETDNPLYGRTNNPWDVDRSPGGSSGGQAAIIAAGGSPLGLGTDIGGSIRVPAASCGIAGLKPTAGRMPDAGRYSFPIGQRAVVSEVGLLAREVEDVALGLEVANGGRNPAVEPPMPLGDPGSVDLSKLRVGYYTDDGIFPASPAVQRAVHEAAETLKGLGAGVTPWTPPAADHAMSLFFGLLSSDGFKGGKRTLGRDKRDPRIAKMEQAGSTPGFMLPAIRALLRASGRRKLAQIVGHYGHHDTDHYWRLVGQQMEYQKRFAAALDENEGGPIDLILCPAFPLPAMRHGATAEFTLAGTYTCLYNVLGYPTGIVPVTRVREGEEGGRALGRDKMDRAAYKTEVGSAGLPIGVQVVARPWREHVAIAAMAGIERAVRESGELPRIAPFAGNR